MNPQTTEVQVEFVLRHILIVPKDGKEEFVQRYIEDEWLPQVIRNGEDSIPDNIVTVLRPTPRYFRNSDFIRPHGAAEWYIIEKKMDYLPTSLPNFQGELKEFVENLIFGDDLWGVSGVTNTTPVQTITRVGEAVLRLERAGLCTPISPASLTG